jgi:hypothetical protein
MNINPNFSDNENNCSPANEVMANGMDFIFEKLIIPMQHKLDAEDINLISIIGLSFKIIAEQATALEELEDNLGQDDFNQNDFSRN